MVASVEVSAVVGNRLGGWENERRDGTAAHLAAGRRAAGLPEPLALPNLARRFHCRGQLHFLRLFQRVFHLRAPLPLSLSLTPTAADLLAVARSPSDAARTLRSLLAIWIPRELEAAA